MALVTLCWFKRQGRRSTHLRNRVAARADRESGEMASIARRRDQRNDERVCRKWRAGITFLAAATCTMLLPAADCFLGPGPGIAIAAKSSGLYQHSFRGRVRGGGCPGTAMALFWPRAPSLSLTSIGGGEGDKKVRRVWRGQGKEDSISIRTMVESDMNGAESKLIEAAKMCVFETFGASEGWQTVGDGFELKYRREKKTGFSFMPAAQDYKHDMCNMMAAELPGGDLVGCVGVELSKITDKGTPWWGGTQQVAKLRPFISDLVVRQSYRGKGVGRVLLEECERLVYEDWGNKLEDAPPSFKVECDLEKMYLKVDLNNEAAMRLYTAAGYHEVGRMSEPGLGVVKHPKMGKVLTGKKTVTNVFLCKQLKPCVH